MIVRTLLDTDLYKFTTSYAYIKLFPYAMGKFSFHDRNETEYTEEFLERLKNEIDKLSRLRLTEEELEYMTRNCRFLPRVYSEWLSSFRFHPDKIKIHLDEAHHLHIEVSDFLYKATLYEVPLLAIVSEIKNQSLRQCSRYGRNLMQIIGESGTVQSTSITFLGVRYAAEIFCPCTGNGYQKIKRNGAVLHRHFQLLFCNEVRHENDGTHPHEWFMFHGAQFGYKHANYMALENWVNVYDGDLGIALSDTYTSGIFLSNLSRKQAKLFDGVRCDSGNEFRFIDSLISRYKELGIDATTKTIVFSNALDFTKALEIQEYCRNKIRCSFRHRDKSATNDTGFEPSNIVMKLTQCKMNVNQEWRECIKLSDDEGKHTGSPEEVQACLYELRLN